MKGDPLRPSPADPSKPILEPLAVGARQLAVMLNVGLRTVRTWDAAGKLPRPVRIGGRLLWLLDEIRDWLQAGCPDRSTWEFRRRSAT